MHIHILGICGTFMGGLAVIASQAGHKVTGCDANVYPPMSTQLQAQGIALIEGFDPRQTDLKPDLFVIGNVVARGNLLMEEILNRGLAFTSGPQWLHENLLRGKWVLAVAGTHGKTTTTSLVASILAEGGEDPTFVIGGRLKSAGSNARLGAGHYLVAEADESDASFTHLQPLIAIVTNIDNDHLVTHDGDFGRLKQSFVDFLHNLPFYGLAVVCLDDENVRSVLEQIGRPVITYGLTESADLRAVNIRPRGLQTDFQVVRAGAAPFEVTVNLPGTHNVLNSLAAIAVALELGVEQGAISRALAAFQGIDRRLQHIADVDTDVGRVTIVDDYGHHPTEVAATLQALRQGYAGRRLVLAFQPHRYTRTRDLIDDFGKALSAADALLVTEVYAAGEAPIAGADGRAICRAVRSRGQVEPVFVEKVEDLASALTDVMRANDVIVTMGAGHISAISHVLPGQLARRRSQ
jgi:UDP-N-acetylmuramate--alanine ligase